MFLASSNKSRRLLILRYVDAVSKDELIQGETEVRALLADLPTGFLVLQDLSQFKEMDAKAVEMVGSMMDLFEEKQVGRVVRVIPDLSKDIGFNILTVFHYRRDPEIIICKNIVEAAAHLA